MFQAFGIDIFTDQEFYGYEKKYRPALISAFAHNTVVANDKDYTLEKKNGTSKITEYSTLDGLEIIRGTHNLYDSIVLNRSTYYLHPNVLVIKDSGNSEKLKSLSQIFNFGKSAKDISIQNGRVVVKFPKEITVYIKTINNNSQSKIKDFYRSPGPYKLENIKQLSISAKGNNIISIIELNSSSYKNPISNISFKNSVFNYEKGGKKHKITF